MRHELAYGIIILMLLLAAGIVWRSRRRPPEENLRIDLLGKDRRSHGGEG
jgi:hypothetical protein